MFRSDYIDSLKTKAHELRLEVLKMIYESDISSGHFGGSLSSAEIVTALYWHAMKVDTANPQWDERDRFVLGKGHSVPIVYAALAHKGYFDKKYLKTYRERGSILQGHPDCLKTPGLDASGGSLGQGLSIALGMAFGAKQSNKNFHVYALLSDGETQEGMVWEAAMTASHYKVGNLTAIIDNNNMQCVGNVERIMNIQPFEDKWRAFGWDCITVDGHDMQSVLLALEIRHKVKNKPFAIICKTTKGKGVSFMENNADWHCSSISTEQYRLAERELNNILERRLENE